MTRSSMPSAGLPAALHRLVLAATLASAVPMAVTMAGCATSHGGATAASGAVVRYDFVAFVQEDKLPWVQLEHIPELEARVLAGDPTLGRYSSLARVPAGFRLDDGPTLPVSTELYVLEGQLNFGAEELGPRDFAFVPPGAPIPALASSGGARVLVFHLPSHPDEEALAAQQAQGTYVTRDGDTRWSRGTVSPATGANVPLEVKQLKKDPHTGARTWLVRIAPGTTVPWTRDSIAEEGFLLDGDYRLSECLRDGVLAGSYTPGGYFHRPGGVVHGGPASGTRTGATWLLRTPGPLESESFTACRDGRGVGPIGTTPAATTAPAAAPAAPGS